MKWTQAQIEYLRTHYEAMTNDAIAAHLGKSRGQVQWQMVRQGWRRSNFKKWTEQELAFVASNAHLGQRGLAEAMNIPQIKIETLLCNRRIRTGGDGKFKKNMNPWNAGLKGFFPGRATCFKKGLVPKNTLHDGAITTRNGMDGRPFQVIRVAKNQWMYVSVHTWIQFHGAVPKGYVIRHKDGDPLHNAINNLECISRTENSNRNKTKSSRAKAALSMADNWADGSRYQNNEWIAKMISKDPEIQKALLLQPELIETKRQQLLLRRKLNNKLYVNTSYAQKPS